MPNTKSAEKRVRQTKVRTLRNKVLKTRVKTFRKKVHAAIETGDLKKMEASLQEFASVVDKAVKSNVVHRNAADRYKSGLARLAASKAK